MVADPQRCFLLKSEPSVYAWESLVRDGRTHWNGVRNAEARNILKEMRVGDQALFYHSNEGREIVGIVRVVRAAYPETTDERGEWVMIDVEPHMPLKKPVTLATLKADPLLSGMAVVKRSRLSVTRVTPSELTRVLELGGVAPTKRAGLRRGAR